MLTLADMEFQTANLISLSKDSAVDEIDNSKVVESRFDAKIAKFLSRNLAKSQLFA